jgi:hypothetical protein
MNLDEFKDMNAEQQYLWLFKFVRAKIVNDMDNRRTGFMMDIIEAYVEKHWDRRPSLFEKLSADSNYEDIMKIVKESNK